MIDIKYNEAVILYLEPGWPRAASSLTASCLALTLSTRLASSSLRPAVSSSMEGMAAVLRTAFSQETLNPCKLLAASLASTEIPCICTASQSVVFLVADLVLCQFY